MSSLPPACAGSFARRPIAAAVALFFALSAPAALAVSNCNDAGPGSLREAIGAAASTATIDLSTLPCSTITLTTGALNVTQDSLTIVGSGRANLLITGKYAPKVIENDRLFKHTGAGQLSLKHLSLAWGNLQPASGEAAGGCVYSAGTAYVNDVGAYLCEAASSSVARGGALYGKSGLTVKYSTLAANEALSTSPGGGAEGGAAASPGGLFMKYSTVDGNQAVGPSGSSIGFGGGMTIHGGATISGSTISRNHAGYNIGGLDVFSLASSSLTTSISNSTISGNTAGNLIGGVYSNSGTVTVSNSTVAFNTAVAGRIAPLEPAYSPGASFGTGATSITLQSSMFSNNTYDTASENDISLGPPPPRPMTIGANGVRVAGGGTNGSGSTIAGSANFVRASFAAMPAGTLEFSCPLLGVLRNNGGPTETHALLSTSPALDVGANPANYTVDQRRSPYARPSGPGVDIGAYERQVEDIVFNNEFDGCPDLL